MTLRKSHHCGSALLSVLLVRVAAYLWWFAPTGALYAAYLPEWKRGCAVCGIGADGKAYGYVCPRLNCPTKVTFGGAV